MSDLLLRKLYGQYERAVRRKHLGRALSLIRKHPALQQYEGDSGNLVDLILDGGPRWLVSVFKAGLHPDAGGGSTAETFLQHAAANGDVQSVLLAIRYGANLERRNNSGETALGYACAWGQSEIVRLLAEAGADVNAIEADPDTGYRCTALDCARIPAIIECLRAHGAKRLEELELESDLLNGSPAR